MANVELPTCRFSPGENEPRVQDSELQVLPAGETSAPVHSQDCQENCHQEQADLAGVAALPHQGFVITGEYLTTVILLLFV